MKVKESQIPLEIIYNKDINGQKMIEKLFGSKNRPYTFDILKNYKLAIKKMEGFTMLTATLLVYESENYQINNQNIISSFRYTNKYNEVKKSGLNGNSYNNFIEDDIKNILPSIKEMVDKGNKEFIEILKNK